LLVILSLGFCLAVVAAFELGLRYGEAHRAEFAPLMTQLHRYSESYGWEPRRGVRLRQNSGITSINAEGYRGRVLQAHDETATRVLMLGDSIAFGLDVDDEQTFSALLDQRPEFEVANLAVQGFGVGQSLRRLEREGGRHAAQVVVLNVCLANDFADSMLPVFLYDGMHPKPYYRIEQARLVLHDEHLRLDGRQRLAIGLREHSALVRRLAWASAPQAVAAAEHWTARKHTALRKPDEARDLVLALVSRTRAVARAQGADFLLVLHPDKPTFRGDTWWADAFHDDPRLSDVPVLDLGRYYRAHGLRFGQLTQDNLGHLSAHGHRVVAEILAQALRDRAQNGMPTLTSTWRMRLARS
jgi:lysophospholipase L1-like esterase